MTKRTHIVAFGLALLLATSVVSASAFTTATITRSADVAISDDSTAVVQIDPNTGMGGIQSDSGKLYLNLGNGNGLNQNAIFWFGDQSDPTATDAFTVTNNDGATHDLNFSYTVADGNTDTNLEFTIHDSNGLVGTFSEENSYTINGASPSATYYVVIKVDTNGLASADSLSGDLVISAT